MSPLVDTVDHFPVTVAWLISRSAMYFISLSLSLCLQLRDNIEKFFTWFVEEGKATVRLKEPAVDICLSKVWRHTDYSSENYLRVMWGAKQQLLLLFFSPPSQRYFLVCRCFAAPSQWLRTCSSVRRSDGRPARCCLVWTDTTATSLFPATLKPSWLFWGSSQPFTHILNASRWLKRTHPQRERRHI